MNSRTIDIETPSGSTTAYCSSPEESNSSGKAVILIQEYWGLNDHIRSIADRYAAQGFSAIAPDLYQGKLATDSGEAAKLMQGLKIEDGIEMIRSTVDAARREFGVSHVGISGYCMGGTYALRAACEVEGVAAAAPFYGDIPPEDVLKTLKTPTIFISATKDGWINPAKVAELEDATERYELPITSVKYEADHAFFNDTRPEVYDEVAAQDAWAMITGFFADKL